MTIKEIQCAICQMYMPITQFPEHMQSKCQRHGYDENARTKESQKQNEPQEEASR